MKVDSLDGIDSAFHSLYTKQADGTYLLTGVEGLKSQTDIDRLNSGLVKERNDHKVAKAALKAYQDACGGITAEELQTEMGRISELELAAEGKIDDKKIEKIVESRIAAKTTPLQRQIDTLTKERDTFKTENEQFKQADVQRTIRGKINEAIKESKGFVIEAIDDALIIGERVFELLEDGSVVTRDNIGVTPGLSPKDWLQDVQPKKPYWWGPSTGAGSRPGDTGGGAGGDNPFTHENWNLTLQGQLIKTNRVQAEKMAKAAGTTIGGLRPAAKK
jgi:hypothetical protein